MRTAVSIRTRRRRPATERFGQETYDPATAWILANREGKPFHAVRLYLMADLKAAPLELECDAAEMERISGG